MSNWWDQAVVALDATSKRWDSNVGTTAEPLKRLREQVGGPLGLMSPPWEGTPATWGHGEAYQEESSIPAITGPKSPFK